MSVAIKALLNAVISAAAMLLTICSACADFIFITCGASSGYSYYTEGGLNPKGNAGWKKDGINAKLQLLIKDDRTMDLISAGAPPNDFYYSNQGCSFSRPSLELDKNELVLVAHCPKQIEMFFFRWNDDKTGELIRVDVASSGLSKHGGALYAACKLGQF